MARRLSLCSFVFGWNDPTYHLSSIRLFIILFVFFFPERGLGIAFVLSLAVIIPLITPVILSKGAWYFSLVFGCDIPTYYPSYLIESFSKGAWHCFNNPTYYPIYLIKSYSRFTVCLSTFKGNKLPLMTLVDLYRGGPAYFQSNWQSGRRGWNCSCFEYCLWGILFHFYQMFSIVSLHSGSRKTKGLGKRTLVLSLGVTTPPVTPVTELDLGRLFFFFSFYQTVS